MVRGNDPKQQAFAFDNDNTLGAIMREIREQDAAFRFDPEIVDPLDIETNKEEFF